MTGIYINIIGDNQEVSRNWLYIIILSLMSSILPNIDINLSANLLFISLAMFVISLAIPKNINFINTVASFSSGIGIILIVVFALKDNQNYIESNFFPIYNNLFYILGISLFFAGVFIQSFILLISKIKFCTNNFSSIALAIIIILAILSLFITFHKLKSTLVGNIGFDHQEFYKIIFCSFSSILNFFFLELFLIVVIFIINIAFFKENHFAKSGINIISVMNILAVISSFLSFFLYNVRSYEFINFYNKHLKIFGNVILGCFIFKSIKFMYKYSNFKR